MQDLPEDIAAILELAARHPEGGATLLEGHLESIAALYQLHPVKVEHVRARANQPENRQLANAILAGRGAEPLPQPAQARPPADPRALIAEACVVSSATTSMNGFTRRTLFSRE